MVSLNDKSEIIQRVCDALISDDKTVASNVAGEYPFVSQLATKRSFSSLDATSVFIRDKFTDRYSGARLIFPGTLRLLSRLLPTEFPAHPNWKMSESHIVYYELFPTVDHVFPVARGGADSRENWATTSMMRNNAKANWTLEELEWELLPINDQTSWDGLLQWFLNFISKYPKHLEDNYIKTWHSAAKRALI